MGTRIDEHTKLALKQTQYRWYTEMMKNLVLAMNPEESCSRPELKFFTCRIRLLICGRT